MSQAEKDLADLLTLLIEDFEEKRYQLPRSKPLDVLRFLMEQHGLLQKDLTDIFGTPSIVSEVLSGKRELNKGSHPATGCAVLCFARAVFLTPRVRL